MKKLEFLIFLYFLILNRIFIFLSIISFSIKLLDGILIIFELPLKIPNKKEYIKFVGTFDGLI